MRERACRASPDAARPGLHPLAGPTDPRSDDLVHRQFRPDGPDRLWVQDITQHPTAEGWVYLAVVIDAWSRRVVGWSIADHLRTELVVDALEMARLRRRPDGTVAHSDHGSPIHVLGVRAAAPRRRAARLDGHRRRRPGQRRRRVLLRFAAVRAARPAHWATRAELARAIFEWIEAFYNPTRRHSTLGYLSPIDYETARGMITTPTPSVIRGELQTTQSHLLVDVRQRGLPPQSAPPSPAATTRSSTSSSGSPTTTADDKRSRAPRHPSTGARTAPPISSSGASAAPRRRTPSARGTRAYSDARTMSRVAAVALRGGPHSATHVEVMSFKGCSDRAETLCTRLTPVRQLVVSIGALSAAIAYLPTGGHPPPSLLMMARRLRNALQPAFEGTAGTYLQDAMSGYSAGSAFGTHAIVSPRPVSTSPT